MLNASYQCESLSFFSYGWFYAWFSYSSILTSSFSALSIHMVLLKKKAEIGVRLLFICDKMLFSCTSCPSISLAHCTPLNGGVLHCQWKIKPPRRYCSMNKMLFPVCILKIRFYHDKSHLFNDTSTFKFLYSNRDKLFYGCSGMHLVWVYISLAWCIWPELSQGKLTAENIQTSV